MSVFEQKMEEDVNGFELVEKEENRTESPEMVEMEDKEEEKDLKVFEMSSSEEEDNQDIVEDESVDPEMDNAASEGAIECARVIEHSSNPQTIFNHFPLHNLKNVESEEELDTTEMSTPWSVPESLEHQFTKFIESVKEREKAQGIKSTAENLEKVKEFYKLIDSEGAEKNGKLLTENLPMVRNKENAAPEKKEEDSKADNEVTMNIGEKIKKSIQEKIDNFENIRLSMNHATLGNHDIVLTKDHLKRSMFVLLPLMFMIAMLILNWMNNLLIASQLTQIAKSIESYCGCAIKMENDTTSWRPPYVTIVYIFLIGHLIRRTRRPLNCFQILVEFWLAVQFYIELRFNYVLLDMLI